MLLDILERKDNLDTKETLEFKIKYMFVVGSLTLHFSCSSHFVFIYSILQFHILLASRLGCKKPFRKITFITKILT